MLSKTKDNIIHLPAYTSVSHEKATAANFSKKIYDDEHIIHIHMKKGDKGIQVAHISHVLDEHETILPRNTKLKINPKPDIYKRKNVNVHVWHATIHHQD